MDISTKTQVTTTHSATVSADEAKALALVAVKGKIGLNASARIISSEARQATDGSISVEVVVDASDSAPAAPAPVLADSVAPAPALAGFVMPAAPVVQTQA